MAIEFPCSACRRLLRVDEASAGKQARCPQCGALTVIPEATTPAAAGAEPSPPDGPASPFAPQSSAPESSAPAGYNPYASPTAAGHYAVAAGPSAFGQRDGPPWERDGMGFRTLVATLKGVFIQPQITFGSMRLDGGYWRPLAFALLNAFLGMLVMVVFNAAILAVMFALMSRAGGLPDEALLLLLAEYGGMLVLSPVYTLIGCFVAAGAHHLVLMAVGGANEGFQATFRAVAYSFGAAHLLLMVPFCGGYLVIVPYVIYTCIGLSYLHNTSGGKAAAAGVTPIVVCCGTIIGSYIALFVAMVSGGF